MTDEHVSDELTSEAEKRIRDQTIDRSVRERDVDNNVSDSDLFAQILEDSEDEIFIWEPVWLPSQGLYYDGAIPDGRVEVRAWGIEADKILSTQRYASSGMALDYIFKKFVRLPDPQFNHEDLLTGDRTFLLYYLRGITHGNVYSFKFTCSNTDCGEVAILDYDLNDLISTVKVASHDMGEEPFRVNLPYLSESYARDVWVQVRFMRGYDTNKLFKTMKTKKPIKRKSKDIWEQVDDSIEKNLQMLVTAVGVGTEIKKDRATINNIIGKMHSKDVATVRAFLDNNEPTIDSIIEIECEHCGEEVKQGLPVTAEFFRPTLTGELRS